MVSISPSAYMKKELLHPLSLGAGRGSAAMAGGIKCKVLLFGSATIVPTEEALVFCPGLKVEYQAII